VGRGCEGEGSGGGDRRRPTRRIIIQKRGIRPERTIGEGGTLRVFSKEAT